MRSLRHTLVSEGPTDANLIPIINWVLREVGGVVLPEGNRAEFWRLRNKPVSLTDQLVKAVEFYPCEVLFVHRDADRESPVTRVAEIREAVANAQEQGVRLPAIAVVPVRMMEAWLCFDERAIRKAAGYPNGTVQLDLPGLKRIESRPDPKSDLQNALRTASGLSGRRLKKFNTAAAFWRIVDYLDDFSPLRELLAFQSFEAAIRTLSMNGWKPGFYD